MGNPCKEMEAKKVLYHGTNAWIVGLSAEERQTLREGCYAALDYMWKIYGWHKTKVKVYGQDDYAMIWANDLEKLKELLPEAKYPYLYSNLDNAFTVYENMITGCGQYQFGDLYVSADMDIAINYALSSFAFGEIGLITYRMYEGIKAIQPKGWNPSPDIKETLEILSSHTPEKAQPVVIPFIDYDIEDLNTDSGEKVDNEIMEFNPYFRYKPKKPVTLDNAVYIAGKNSETVTKEMKAKVDQMIKDLKK